MSKARDLADFISTGSILSDGTIESTEISGVTADATEINKLDGLTADTAELNKLDGVTATTAELNKLAGTTATTSDFDKLSNVTASATELNYMTGATSSIQSQLDNISVTSGSLTKSFTNGESATITLAQSITPAPVVSVTKEVAQTGQSSKGAWDVNATASNYDLHNTAYSTTLTPSGFDISSTPTELNATKKEYSLNTSQAGNSYDLFFKPDGTKMFIANGGNAGTANLVAYTLSTAWDITTASYANETYDTSAYESWSDGLWFKSDGTYVYLTSQSNTGVISFELTTAWDVSTANSVYIQNLSITNPKGVTFKPDGTIMYVGDPNNKSVKEFSLTTAWDITTASLTTTKNTQVQGRPDSQPTSISFNSDGTIMFINDIYAQYVQKFTLSTAWDTSSATFDSELAYATISGGNAYGHFMDASGSRLYFTSYIVDKVVQVTLPSALTLGTGSFASTDVGKRIQGNGGDVILTSTAGAYDTTGGSDFTDTSTIASGSWTMHGLKSAGASDGLTMTSREVEGTTFNTVAPLLSTSSVGGDFTSIIGMAISRDGYHLYVRRQAVTEINHFILSTPFDLSTATSIANSYNFGLSGSAGDVEINDDGTKLYVTYMNSSNSYIRQYTLGTPYSLAGTVTATTSVNLTSIANQATTNTASDGGKMHFSADGTKLYFSPYAYLSNNALGTTHPTNPQSYYTDGGIVWQWTLGTAWDLSSTKTYNGYARIPHNGDSYNSFSVTSDGKWLISGTYNEPGLFVYPLLTPFDVTTADGNSEQFVNTTTYSNDNGANHGFIGQRHVDGKLFSVSYSSQVLNANEYATLPNRSVPLGTYNLAVTNASGQIDSSFWTDINSMTADQSLGDGEAYYAVSTDDRTTWSVAKGSDGVRPIVRDNAGTWQYNSDAGSVTGGSLSNGSFVSEDTTTFQTGSTKGVADAFWGDSGNHLFILDGISNSVLKYSVSTAYDFSTINATPVQTFSVSAQEIYLTSMWFSPDGLHMYIGGNQGNDVNEYTLTSAWDLSTASFTRNSISAFNVGAISFSNDGTIIHTYRYDSNTVGQATLSTAWDTSTAGSFSYPTLTSATYVGSVFWASNGYTLYVGDPSQDVIHKYTVSTAYDLSSSITRTETLDVSAKTSNPQGIVFNSDLSKLYVMDGVSAYTYNTTQAAYGTSTTWTNATTNDEFYALQQALGVQFNRMDKTQLDAVADGSHFTLGNTLDLMIALKQDTASASLPTSDGVTINYDAEALNQGAVLGTDYDFDFPANNKVRITSNAAQNLKIRVV